MRVDRKRRISPKMANTLDRRSVENDTIRLQFHVTRHAIERMKERCVLAKTLDHETVRQRIVDLARSSTAWGHRQRLAPGDKANFRLCAWGPFRLILCLTHDGGDQWAVKTIVTEEMARQLAVANLRGEDLDLGRS